MVQQNERRFAQDSDLSFLVDWLVGQSSVSLSEGRADKDWEPSDKIMLLLLPENKFSLIFPPTLLLSFLTLSLIRKIRQNLLQKA
jgi:hypothetical protein